MVVVGNFSVRIVDATTKAAFQEHVRHDDETKNGIGIDTFFCEAEPWAEYFIELGVVGSDDGGDDDDDNNKDAKRRYSFRCLVDGKPLGSLVTMRATAKAPHRVGLFSIQNGVQTMTALRWTKPTKHQTTRLNNNNNNNNNNDDTNDAASTTIGRMGSVTVQVFESVLAGMKHSRKNFEPTFHHSLSTTNLPTIQANKSADADKAPLPLATNHHYRGGKSVLRTDVGATKESSSDSVMAVSDSVMADKPSCSTGVSNAKTAGNGGEETLNHVVANTKPMVASCPHKKVSFKTGALLQEITIHYCTSLGLIHAGVLDKPPHWDYVRMTQMEQPNRKRPFRDDDDLPEPTKRIHIPAVYDGTMMVAAAKDVELFDFTVSTANHKNTGKSDAAKKSRSDSLTDTTCTDTCSNSSMDEDTVGSNKDPEGDKEEEKNDTRRRGSKGVCIVPRPSILLGKKRKKGSSRSG